MHYCIRIVHLIYAQSMLYFFLQLIVTFLESKSKKPTVTKSAIPAAIPQPAKKNPNPTVLPAIPPAPTANLPQNPVAVPAAKGKSPNLNPTPAVNPIVAKTQATPPQSSTPSPEPNLRISQDSLRNSQNIETRNKTTFYSKFAFGLTVRFLQHQKAFSQTFSSF